MTCDHTRRIMACSGGFPGAYNDKTIARYDALISDVAVNPLYTDFVYNVATKTGVVQKKGRPSSLLSLSSHALLFICNCVAHN
jgi:hypothetical protein